MTVPVRMAVGDGVARVTLAAPGRCNALTAELLDALNDTLDRAAAEAPRALVLAAEGRHFSTGGDVARFAAEVAAGRGEAYARRTLGGLNAAMLRLMRMPCPVIACAQGAVTGGALGLLLAADLAVLGAGGFVQPYYAEVGFAPDGGWTALLPGRIGPARALEIQILNRRIDAGEAAALGIVQAVAVAPEAQVEVWLDTLSRHVPGTLADTKRLIRDTEATERALAAELDAFTARIGTVEVRDGMARFLAGLKEARR